MGSARQNNLTAFVEIQEASHLKSQYDAIVVGAGSAGVAAAICAARAGLSTLLVERNSSPGGGVEGACVHSLCGLYLSSPDAIARPANGGFALEFAERLLKSGSAIGPVRMERMDILLQEPALFSLFCSNLIAREKNLTTVFDAHLEAAEGTDSHLEAVKISSHGEPIRASVFIDTSGDGLVALLSGAAFEMDSPSDGHGPAYFFRIGDVAANVDDHEGRRDFSRKIVEGIRKGFLNPQLAAAVLCPTPGATQARAIIDLADEGDHFSPLNPEWVTQLQILGCNLATELESYLRENVEGFKKCTVSVCPIKSTVSRSRRILGRYQLTARDILEAAEFPDTVSLSSWPLEVRGFPKIKHPPHDKPSGIPLRCLISRDFENLLMAGRCMSSTHGAQGALRVVGTSLAMGQAAGLAAVAVVRSTTKSIPCGMEPEIARPILEEVLKGA